MANYKHSSSQNNNLKLHKQIWFWVIIISTIAVTSLTSIFIISKLNLVFAPENLETYKNLKDIFSIPIYLVSVGMTSLGFYALWFRTLQTNEQIFQTQKQIAHQIEIREIDALKNQIESLSSFLLELINKEEPTPNEVIAIKVKSMGGIKSHNLDFQNKLVKYLNRLDEESLIPWSNTMENLEFIINAIGIETTKEIYKENKISYATQHKNISYQINILLVCCNRLAAMDKTSFLTIKLKLSLFLNTMLLLEKMDLISSPLVEQFHVLRKRLTKHSLLINA